MLCKTCKFKLRDIPKSFDAFGMFQVTPQYCTNEKCKDFGYVVMIGYPEEELNTNPNAQPNN